MNPSDDERGLADEYRRASAAEAGRPPAPVRKAILAEAAAAAQRRTPAANDSRYLWRGIAGVAVLGFAILMWQQVDHRLPGDAPVASQSAPAQVLQETSPRAAATESKAEVSEVIEAPQAPLRAEERPAPPAAVADAAADFAEPLQSRAAEMESAATPAAAGATANAMQTAPAPALASAPPPSAAPAALQRSEPARALGKMSAAQDASVDADALLRLHFPQQYQSATPHSVWLVQDSTGAVLRSGELAPGQTLGAIRPAIERELGSLLRPWRIRSLMNARGQTIELGIAQTP